MDARRDALGGTGLYKGRLATIEAHFIWKFNVLRGKIMVADWPVTLGNKAFKYSGELKLI